MNNFTQIKSMSTSFCFCVNHLYGLMCRLLYSVVGVGRLSTFYTGSSKKMDGIWNRYYLKSTRRIYTFGVLKCLEKFKVLDLP